jgi:hypothetical protein
MAASLSKESMELEQRHLPQWSNDCTITPAHIESTGDLQQSTTDAVASYTNLPSCDAAVAAAGYSSLWFTSHDEMYTRVTVDSYIQSTTTNSAIENYIIAALAEDQRSEPGHSDGYLQPVDAAYCEVLDDAGSSDVTSGAIASHHNALSAAKLLKCQSRTSHTSKSDVSFSDTDKEQIT